MAVQLVSQTRSGDASQASPASSTIAAGARSCAPPNSPEAGSPKADWPETQPGTGALGPAIAATPLPPNRPWEALQRLIGVAALIATLPLMALAFVLVKATSRGPFLFAQLRRGLSGRPFLVYKIRTLHQHSEHATALGVGPGEPAVTAVGRLLRRLKIDEVPQFWNIANGTMNLVGPRPIPLALEEELEQHIPDFAERHRVKPGLSSLGQIAILNNHLGDSLVADWQQRFESERHYLRNRSVAYDLAVIVLTALYVLRSMVTLGRRKKPLHAAQRPCPASEQRTVTRVLGAPIADLNYDGVVQTTEEWIAQGKHEYVAIAPVHSVVEGTRHAAHRTALEDAGVVTADGMPIVWAQRLLGHKHASRVYGPTLMLHLLERAVQNGWRVGFYGGAKPTLNILIDRLRLRFPKLQVACAISPPFRTLTDREDATMVTRINASRPDILFVGLGCPKQELWMHEHRTRLQTVQFGVGAAFSFHAGQLRQAPAILQGIGLEWLFRLCCEPRRLFRRYATTNPVFLARFSVQLLGRWILRRNHRQPWLRHDRNPNV